MNDSVLLQFFQRMRVPLVVLISAYAIATAGFTLMPGVDDQGEPHRLSLFEAFYIVSYTGSTIGFGEVPYAFTPAQRLWTIVSIYLTVIAWLYSIGSIISMLRDPALVQTIRRARFRRAVNAIHEPFYLVCGYGDTGRLLTRALTARGHPVVVIDKQPEKIDALATEILPARVVPFCMDASMPDHLVKAGLRHRWCLGAMAVTGENHANLKIAVAAKLLNQHCTVHARADRPEVADNMRSFATDHVVNPVEQYVLRMRLAIEQPMAFRLYHWLQSGPEARVPEVARPPSGRWILCGFGRIGQATYGMLKDAGMQVTVIEHEPDRADLPDDAVKGYATQAETLQAAGVEQAVGVLATTSDDVDNLSILMTARTLNDQLFFGVVENGLSSHALFQAAKPDFIGQPSRVIAGTILSRIRSPLVPEFLDRLLAADETVAEDLLERLQAFGQANPPELMTVRISQRRAPALTEMLENDVPIDLAALRCDPLRRERGLPIEALLLRRDNDDQLLPADSTRLAVGDQLLLAGRFGIGRRLGGLLESENMLYRALTGQDRHQGWLWKRLFPAAKPGLDR
jgi:Trk K+ transport system NAD-binding subunit